MKKFLILLLMAFLHRGIHAQLGEAQQLLLNIEKLAQLRQILQNMYEGYEVLYKGYTTIKDISEGSFSLHKTFLDRLLEVSPAIKRYKKVAGILSYQASLVRQYQQAWNAFRSSGVFTPGEITYIGKVYRNLLGKSAQSLDDLFLIITAGHLRMGDEERLAAIDRIYEEVKDQYAFLKTFTNSTGLLSLQRKKEKSETNRLKKLYHLKQ